MALKNGIVIPKIHLKLNHPSMTALHRAGTAGLWMTLKRLEKLYPTPAERVGNVNWFLRNHSISISWEGEDFAVLDWLFKESFQISEEGLISLTGLNPETMSFETRLSMHLGIINTFIQNNKFFKSAGFELKELILNGKTITVEYKKAKSNKNQDFAKNVCDKNRELLTSLIGIRSWLYPGAAVRHYAFPRQTNFEESIALAIALLFVPVACQYFFVRSQMQLEQINYAIFLLEVVSACKIQL